MTTQGVLVESVFSGLTGEVGDFVNKRLSGGRVAFHPSGGGNTYKNVYASATVGGSTLLDQSVNQGILLDGSGSAEVYAVGHYLCKAYDSNGVLQRTFDLRIGSVTSDSSGDSAVSTSTLNIKTSYGTNASDINDAITYANANSANSFVFLFEDANFTVENNMIFPSNVTIQVEPTAKLMIYAGVNSVTINGAIKNDFNQVFKYENNTTCTITIDPQFTEQIYPQWFGAVPDGTSDSSFLVTKALATGIKRLVLAGGNFKLNSNITIPSDVEIIRKGGADFTLANGVTITGLGTKATVFDTVELSNGTLANLALSAIADPNTGLYFPSADILALVTGGVQRVMVDANGKVGIGTSSFDGNWNPNLQINNSNSDGTGGFLISSYKPAIILKDLSGGNPERKHIWADNNVLHLGGGDTSQNAYVSIDSTGKVFMPSLAMSGLGNPVYITSSGELWENGSSKRFKTNIENLKSIDSSLIYKLNVVEYDRVNEEGEAIPGTHEIGFIAEEVEEILPIIVNYDRKEKESDPNIPRGVDKSILIPLIITEMKKLKAEIKELKEKISELEKK